MKLKTITAAVVMTFAVSGAQAAPTVSQEGCKNLASSSEIYAELRDQGISREMMVDYTFENSSGQMSDLETAITLRIINMVHKNPEYSPAEMKRDIYYGCMSGMLD